MFFGYPDPAYVTTEADQPPPAYTPRISGNHLRETGYRLPSVQPTPTVTVNRYDGYPCHIEPPATVHTPLRTLSGTQSAKRSPSHDAAHRNTIPAAVHHHRAFQKYQQNMFSSTSLDGSHVHFGDTSITIAGPPYEDLPRRSRGVRTREPLLRRLGYRNITGIVIASILILLCLALLVVLETNKDKHQVGDNQTTSD